MGQIDDFVHEIARKSCFFEDTNMDHPLWRGLAIQKSEVSSFWRLPLKNMGNILRSDLWAGPVALRLSDRRHLIFIHRLDTQNFKKYFLFVFPTITG